uniref:Allergen Cul o 8 n=1 Tax=Culicoides obsoletus TaxID=289301 RepID=A0A7U3MHS6_CULOB|nr:allergen Cul o 8 [Culicoides obsoletus]
MSIFIITFGIFLAIIGVSCQRSSSTLSSVCRGGSSRGTCNANVSRFYYNERTNNCQKFSWSGCGGNENNFVYKESCKSRCVQKPKQNLRDHPELKKCFLKPDEGIGRAMHKKYYYDRGSRRCQDFYYGGMYGNENRFDSMDDCYEKCASRINPYLKLVPNNNKIKQQS